MEINPSSAPSPHSHQQRVRRQASAPTEVNTESSNSEIPKIGLLQEKLSSMDGVRDDLVNRVREELDEGEFFNEDRIQRTVSKLASLL